MSSKSTEMDLVITGGTLVLNTGTQPGNIAVKDGKIAAITSPDVVFPSRETIDASHQLVFPGGVDPHVHFKEPGAGSVRENFGSGTRQAAAGGITTTVEMPLSDPLVTSKDAFDLKVRTADPQVVTDYALWGLLPSNELHRLDELIDCGSVAFKTFLSTDPDAPKLTDYHLLQSMKAIAKQQRFIGFHAENASIIDFTAEQMEKGGITGGLAHLQSRPDIAEIEAISRIALFSEETGCDIHICHLSSGKARETIRAARNRGVSMTVETCPSYLVLDDSDLDHWGVFAKCNPPIREKANQEILWDMLFKGEINMIGSDHCPYTDEDRLKHDGDIWAVPPGLPGIELMFPIMLDAGLNKRGMPAEKIAELLCYAPAKRFGLSHSKGSLRVGGDADIVLADPNKKWTYEGAKSLGMQKSSLTPWEGKEFTGQVTASIVRGKTVFREGEILVDAGYGQLIYPEF
ncbi:allantoinase AllB [Vibrio sp. SCSIO 43137]|uniref:allantoinase AllB n=1 Tax=Vibrio sp. SCSIO 43137 TaxID=3021011 RepID=UPI0023082656|nr:allantoinase AllB [Vibrio sp. SCSIO 43137]WCE28892.1 allantoinase AllB [Vibrio sp. SCSIO 43137]